MLKVEVNGPNISVNVNTETGLEFEADLIEMLAALYNTYGSLYGHRDGGNALLSWIGKVVSDGTVIETAKHHEGGEVK